MTTFQSTVEATAHELGCEYVRLLVPPKQFREMKNRAHAKRFVGNKTNSYSPHYSVVGRCTLRAAWAI